MDFQIKTIGLIAIQLIVGYICCMAKKPRRGRPKLPKGESKASIITLRLQPAERRAADVAAKREGITLSEWIRLALMRAATQVTMDQSKTEGVGV